MVGNFIAGEGVLNDKTWIKKYKNGLPKILGLKLKHQIEFLLLKLQRDEQPSPFDRAIISTLGIFRAMSLKEHIPKFGTVTDPFNGICETLPKEEILSALSSLGALTYFEKIKLGSPKFF
jgi:hypothetical protein